MLMAWFLSIGKHSCANVNRGSAAMHTEKRKCFIFFKILKWPKILLQYAHKHDITPNGNFNPWFSARNIRFALVLSPIRCTLYNKGFFVADFNVD
jgi:hypothetical protein